MIGLNIQALFYYDWFKYPSRTILRLLGENYERNKMSQLWNHLPN